MEAKWIDALKEYMPPRGANSLFLVAVSKALIVKRDKRCKGSEDCLIRIKFYALIDPDYDRGYNFEDHAIEESLDFEGISACCKRCKRDLGRCDLEVEDTFLETQLEEGWTVADVYKWLSFPIPNPCPFFEFDELD